MSSDDEVDEVLDGVEEPLCGPSHDFKSKISSINDTYETYYTKARVTKPFLTKFEQAKILGIRSEMISNGSIALVPVPAHISNTYDIAKMEFKEKKIPLMIKRHLPNGDVELWRLTDLTI